MAHPSEAKGKPAQRHTAARPAGTGRVALNWSMRRDSLTSPVILGSGHESPPPVLC